MMSVSKQMIWKKVRNAINSEAESVLVGRVAQSV